MPAFSQNTKGDKPVRNQRQVRETKSKSVRKKSKGSTRDIAGRRLRTRNKSSANRANSSYTQSSPYQYSRKRGVDRASKARGRTFSNSPRESRSRAWTGDISGHRIRTKKPSRNDAARSNVYPQNGAYVNNPSRKPKNKPPKVYTRTASGKPVVNRSPKQKQRAWKGNIRGGIIGSPSATGSVSNVYPQNGAYSRYATKSPRKSKTKTYSNSGIAGRNARLSSSGMSGGRAGYPRSATSPFIKRGKRNVYWGKYSKGERPFMTDLSGNPIRGRNFRSAAPGFAGIGWMRAKIRKPGGDRAYRGIRGGYVSGSARGQRAWIGDLAGKRIRSPKRGITNETAGVFQFPRKMSISGNGRAGRQLPGGGYSSRSNKRRNNRPLPARSPGIGASGIMKNLARTKGQRPMRGGGSVSGGGWNNKGRALSPKIAGAGTLRAARYQGNLRRVGGPSDQGEEFTGTIKAHRPLKGGGSVSGRTWNNRRTPINVRQPGSGTMRAGNFSGNIKAGRPLKGGGSISGRTWNNKLRPIEGKTPSSSQMRAGNFSGNIKAGRPEKGGGSISGRTWNNKLRPIEGKTPSSSQMRAGNFSGNIKAGRPEKGGGSISGHTWNNKLRPIEGRTPSSTQMRAGNFSGNIKAKRPEKGGGSVSGRIWNNKEKPLENRPASSSQVRAGSFSGNSKTRSYIQNPNAHDESILKKRPDETTYKVAGLQVKVKRGKYEDKPKAAEGAMPGIGPNDDTRKASEYVGKLKQGKYETKPKAAEGSMLGIGPKEGTVKASKYGGNVKLARNYKHNPKSHEDALKGIGPTKSSVKASEYSSSMKIYWKYKHSPNGSEEALKVRAPNKAYARIGDYQGNIKMRKYNDHRLHPDAQFAHKNRGNVKEDRTIMMDVKLLWSKIFKKSDTQPASVKEKPLKPRYDRSEKGLWADDPAYQKKKNEPKVKVE